MERLNYGARVYHFQWINPNPDDAIAHINLKSAMENPAPAVIAITVNNEPATEWNTEPGTELEDLKQLDHTDPRFKKAFLGFFDDTREAWRKTAIPPRSETATKRQLDLTWFYNADLFTSPHTGRHLDEAINSNLKRMPQGVQTFNDVAFDVRGIVVLDCLSIGEHPPFDKNIPQIVEGIPVGKKAGKLHFLHFCAWLGVNDQLIARYHVHYKSGKTETIPIRYNMEIQDWWYRAFEIGTDRDTGKGVRVPLKETRRMPPSLKIAWQGSSDFHDPTSARIRVYQFEWLNPHPEEEISHIDLESAMSGPCPSIIAITVE